MPINILRSTWFHPVALSQRPWSHIYKGMNDLCTIVAPMTFLSVGFVLVLLLCISTSMNGINAMEASEATRTMVTYPALGRVNVKLFEGQETQIRIWGSFHVPHGRFDIMGKIKIAR